MLNDVIWRTLRIYKTPLKLLRCNTYRSHFQFARSKKKACVCIRFTFKCMLFWFRRGLPAVAHLLDLPLVTLLRRDTWPQEFDWSFRRLASFTDGANVDFSNFSAKLTFYSVWIFKDGRRGFIFVWCIFLVTRGSFLVGLYPFYMLYSNEILWRHDWHWFSLVLSALPFSNFRHPFSFR